jgi:Phosphofructokinase N-terminal domain yeast
LFSHSPLPNLTPPFPSDSPNILNLTIMPAPDLKNIHDYISGISCISLIAPTEDLFHETIEWYTDLGFQDALIYDRTNPKSKREVDHCLTSEKETWLCSAGLEEGESDVTIKIRFVAEDVHWKAPEVPMGLAAKGRRMSMALQPEGEKKDWRGSGQAIVLHTKYMDKIVGLMKARGTVYQVSLLLIWGSTWLNFHGQRSIRNEFEYNFRLHCL